MKGVMALKFTGFSQGITQDRLLIVIKHETISSKAVGGARGSHHLQSFLPSSPDYVQIITPHYFSNTCITLEIYFPIISSYHKRKYPCTIKLVNLIKHPSTAAGSLKLTIPLKASLKSKKQVYFHPSLVSRHYFSIKTSKLCTTKSSDYF